MGCTNCKAKGGCTTRKEGERELLAELMPSLYPGRVWGSPDDAARFRNGVSEAEGRRLARQAAELLRARTYFQPGGDEEACDFIYILCVGREPGLWEMREDGGLPDDLEGRIRERYLRAALSSMAPVAAVQEVAFELDREDDLYAIREIPRPGVYDPALLKRTQKLIDLLVGSGIHYLDFALLSEPPLGFADGPYPERFGQRPGIVNYLFYPQPATAVGTVYVPARAASERA